MKKRLLAIAMATLMGFSLVACSSGSSEPKVDGSSKAEESKDGESKADESKADAGEKKAATDFKVGMVTDVGLGRSSKSTKGTWYSGKVLGVKDRFGLCSEHRDIG